MKFFDLTLVTGSPPSAQPLSVPSAMVSGSVSFGAVSVLAYSIWAYHWVPGTAGLYTATAAVYVGLGGLVLSRLVDVPGAWRRFPPLFALSFAVYALGWCACWFGLRGRFFADFWGAALGLAGMTAIIRRAFAAPAGFLRLFLVLLACHSLGYYLGGQLYSPSLGVRGKLLWGAFHGLGFGAGLGYLLARCQPRRPADGVRP